MKSTQYNIAHFVYSLATGGQEKLIRDLAIHQKQDGHQVTIYCLAHKKGPFTRQLEDKNISVIAFHKTAGFKISLIFQIIKELKNKQIQFVHTHNHVPNFYASLAAFFTSVKTVINTRHGLLLPGMDKSRQEKLFKAVSAFTHRVVFVSNEARNQFLKAGIVSENKSIYIPNGVELGPFLDNKSDVDNALLNESNRCIKIGTVARLEEVKDLPTLIKTADILKQSFLLEKTSITIKFMIAGDGSMKNELLKMITDYDLSDMVMLLGERTDIPDVLNTLDVFLLTSKSESMPLTLIEAMASGLPIVATHVGGIPDVVMDGVTGFLSPIGNAEKLAEKLEILIKDREKAIYMGKLGRERALDYFSLQTMAEKYMQLYLNPKSKF